jgi:tetratricopeptide (TPR) repeat protein
MAKRARHGIGHAPLRRRRSARSLAFMGILLASCATPTPLETTTQSLLRELVARTGSTEYAIVPFDVDPEAVERARALVGGAESRARRLADLLGDPEGFALRYEWATTGTASDTLAHGGGNCLALSSVLIGLARGLGLEARYLLVRLPQFEPRLDGNLAVYADHVAAVIWEGGERIYVDYSGELANAMHVRTISDVAATAHLYTNRGYERIYRASKDQSDVPWERVSHDFELATRVLPRYAWGWNNLGVARARLGDDAGARAAYERAIAIDEHLASAHVNLVALFLRTNALQAAETHLEHAARLNPRHSLLGTLREALEAAQRNEAQRRKL